MASHYKQLDELIFDEEKLVTVISITNDLKLSSNVEASTLLDTYIKDHIGGKKDLQITYLVAGTLIANTELAICLVKKQDLDEKKLLFKKINSVVVYSLQKGAEINYHTIAAVNDGAGNIGGILKSKNYVKRNITTSNTKTAPEPVPSKSKEVSDIKDVKIVKEQNLPKSKSNSKGGIANFFGKAQIKTEKKETKDVAAVKKEEEDTQDVEMKVIKPEIEDTKVDNKNKVKKAETTPKKDKDNNKKRKQNTKSSAPNKKRRRIQEICDSDSSDILDETENDNMELSDEEPPPAPIVKPSSPVPKNKRRKAVDKTYVDEEGFLVTTTEYVYESMSEQEEEEEKKEPIKENIPKEIPVVEKKKANGSANVKANGNKGKSKTNAKQSNTKQLTLMNFFKK